jgi:glycosyltransferase involved in cell wall biosynthesis
VATELAVVDNPRILYIVRRIPFPLNSGTRIRQFQLLYAYAQMGEVVLVCFYTNEDELAGTSALSPYCAAIHTLPFRRSSFGMGDSRLRQALGRLRLAASARPFLAIHCFSHQMKGLVEEMAPCADLIHVGRLYMIPHVESLLGRVPRGPRFVLDLDDIESVQKRRALRVSPPGSWRRRALEHLDLRRLRRYQTRAQEWFDRILVCSDTDRRRLGNGTNLAVVPNGTGLPPEILPDRSDGRTLLCLGTYGHWPNVDGLRYFVEQIFPRIRQEIDGARLMVVGRDAPQEILALHDGDSIWVEGTVPSVEEYYQQATIAIVPLRIGSGTRLKILEAFALGRPVVSTSMGCEGLEALDGEHLLVGDDPVAFARACIDLLRDPKLRDRLVHGARKLVESKYTWNSIHQRMQTVARELLEDPRGGL